MAYGSLADSAVILHRCDTPACVRPDHLVSGTQRENIRDCTNKRRNRREGTRSTKLSADSVRKIRTEYDRGDTQQILAARYGMSQTGISHIVLRKTWSWVE